MYTEEHELVTQDIDSMEVYELYEDLTSVVLNCYGKKPDGLMKLWYDFQDFLLKHNICTECGGEIVATVTYDPETGSYEKYHCSECGAEIYF